MSEVSENIYPSIPKRIKASLADSVIFLITAVFIMSIYYHIGVETPFIALIVLLPYLLYEPILVSTRGQTIGHVFLGIQVVDKVSIGRVSFFNALFRFIAKVFLGAVSLAWAFFTNRQQALHDIVSKSVVINSNVSLESFKESGLPVNPFGSAGENLKNPSKLRKVLIIVLWWFIATRTIEFLLSLTYEISCSESSDSGSIFCTALTYLFLSNRIVILLITIFLGVKGKLPGAIVRKPEANPTNDLN